MSNYIADTTGTKFSTDLQEATFANCIITGNQYNEIVPDKENSAAFNFLFDYCYVSVNDEIFGTFANSFTHCLREGETKFIDSYNHNFQLDTLSVAIDAASAGIVSGTVPDISRDLKGVSRTENGPPDLGAYERKIK
jgi:hypothetical protein